MKNLLSVVIFSIFISISQAHANLPLPQPSGPSNVVDAMRGMNALSAEILQARLLKQQLTMMQQQQRTESASQAEVFAQQSMVATIDEKISHCLEYSAIGHSCYWHHPRFNNRLTITPVREATYNGNKKCRNYRLIIQTQRETAQIINLACRLSQGRWVRVD